jgi:hypothetical protein
VSCMNCGPLRQFRSLSPFGQRLAVTSVREKLSESTAEPTEPFERASLPTFSIRSTPMIPQNPAGYTAFGQTSVDRWGWRG